MTYRKRKPPSALGTCCSVSSVVHKRPPFKLARACTSAILSWRPAGLCFPFVTPLSPLPPAGMGSQRVEENALLGSQNLRLPLSAGVANLTSVFNVPPGPNVSHFNRSFASVSNMKFCRRKILEVDRTFKKTKQLTTPPPKTEEEGEKIINTLFLLNKRWTEPLGVFKGVQGLIDTLNDRL